MTSRMKAAGITGATTAAAAVVTKLGHYPTSALVAEIVVGAVIYLLQILLQHREKESVAKRRAQTVDNTVPKDGSPEQLREWTELVKAIGGPPM